jgi:small GTP-binding protein
MARIRTTTGLLLLVVLAFVGFLLVYLPPKIVEQYRAVSELGSVWLYVYFTAIGLGAALMLGCTVWIVWRLWRGTRRKQQHREQHAKSPSQLTREQQEREIAENLSAVEDLQSEQSAPAELKRELRPMVQRIEAKREQQKLEIVAFGTISSGKSSLLNALAGRDVFRTDAKGGTTVRRNEVPWPGLDKVTLVDTPGLGEVEGVERAGVSAAAAKDADVVLVVVDGPLRDSEFRLLAQLGQMEKRVLLCLNKEDWYDEHERLSLLGQIAGQVKDYVRAEDVVAVRAQPTERTRVRVLSDGTQSEERIEVAPDISPLAERLMHMVRHEASSLLMANLLLQSRGLVEEARNKVRQSLDKRAWEIVDKYMWGAGGAAALSPFPLVDLAAGCAISTKMVVDLAGIYRQEVDLNVAVNLLGQLGKNLIGILGASAATPAVAVAVASLLKTVPGVGTIAGGLLQGVVQAIITRWIGAVFIKYFSCEMQQPEGGLATLARKEWERITSIAELRKLVQAARSHLTDEESE